MAKKPTRVIKVVGYFKLPSKDGAYGYPLAQIAEELADEISLHDLDDLVISEEPVDPKTIGRNKPKKRRTE